MSKALELAKDYARYCLLRGGITFSHQFDELAKELRRLAQVEAEHAALLKAISDAKPVAHLWQHGDTGRTRIVMPDQIVTADSNWSVVWPLYTLNGIKKP